MFNKNLLLILAVAVLLVGGILFAVFNNNFSNTNPPAARSGELTRELAKQMLLEKYKDKPVVQDAIHDKYWKAYHMPGSIDTSDGKALSQKGLVREINDGNNSTTFMFDFTEEGKKYLTVSNYNPYPDKPATNDGVILGNFKSLEVTGITKISDSQMEVLYEIEYILTPFGEIIKPELVKTEEIRIFTLYDDGWRI